MVPLLEVTAEDLDDGLSVFAEVDQLGAFDAVVVALARRRATVLAWADQEFAAVRDLEVLDPADPDFLKRASDAGR